LFAEELYRPSAKNSKRPTLQVFFFNTQIPIAAFQTNSMQCAIGAFTTLDKVIKALTFWGLWKDMSRLHAQLLILQLRRRVSEAARLPCRK